MVERDKMLTINNVHTARADVTKKGQMRFVTLSILQDLVSSQSYDLNAIVLKTNLLFQIKRRMICEG